MASIKARIERLERALSPPVPPAKLADPAEWERAMATLGEAMGEILGIEPLTVDELQDYLTAAGIGAVDRGPDAIRRAEQRARDLLCDELGVAPEAITDELLQRVLKGGTK